MRAARAAALGAVLVTTLLVATAGSASAAVAHSATADTCDPSFLGTLFGIDECPGDEPAPSPTAPALPLPTLPGLPGVPGVPALPGITGPGATPAPTPAPDAPADSGAPVFTTTPASLSGDTLTIEGLHGIAIVTVPLADGSTRRALRIEADRVVVGGFQLDVPSGEGGLRNTATTLTVDGHVVIYTPSITGIVAGEGERVIDTLSTPTPESLSSLLTVTLPLLGLLADSIVYDDSHQATM